MHSRATAPRTVDSDFRFQEVFHDEAVRTTKRAQQQPRRDAGPGQPRGSSLEMHCQRRGPSPSGQEVKVKRVALILVWGMCVEEDKILRKLKPRVLFEGSSRT